MSPLPQSPIQVFIEIEQGSDQKYEYDKQTQSLQLDRILSPPYVYPYAYGFIPNTLAEDGDELDILVITQNDIPKNTHTDVYIIGALLMEDEKGNDHKILTVPIETYESSEIQSVYDLSSDILESIQTFFANYKKSDPKKWSKVDGFVDKDMAIQIYQNSINN
jgi:inorganic pyrophosphatase